MHAATYAAIGDLRVTQYDDPPLGPADLQLRVEACGVCGSDVASYLHGHYVVPGQVLGHEMSAVVAARGSDLIGIEVGDRVAVRPARSCGVCNYCRAGDTQLCGQSGARTLGYGVRGGYAETVFITDAVVGADVIVVPPELSADEVLWAEPLAVAVHAVAIAVDRPSAQLPPAPARPLPARLLVIGGGSVGLCVLAAARALGIDSVVVSEPRADRRHAAQLLGAQAITPAELTAAGQFDQVIDTSGSAAAIAASLGVLAPGGRLVPVGLGDLPMPWPIGSARIVSSFAYVDADFRVAVEYIVSGRVRLGRFVSHRYSLAETGAGIEASAVDASVIKAAIVPGQA